MARKPDSRDVPLHHSLDVTPCGAYDSARQIIDERLVDEYCDALHLLEFAASAGIASAQNDLGTMIRSGMGCAPDIARAIAWYEAAAAQEEPTALYNLALLYLHGCGVSFDRPRAAELLVAAAAQGNTEAACDLGTMYMTGEGVGRDIVRAAWLHVQAAESGDVVAMGNLASYSNELARRAIAGDVRAAHALSRIYRGGLSGEKDPVQAWAWIRWARDVCVPDEDCASSSLSALAADYDSALGQVPAAMRRAGDRWLMDALKKAETFSQPRWQKVLECGAEGDSVVLMGRWSWRSAKWIFKLSMSDSAMTMSDEGPVSEREPEEIDSWRAALALMDKYAWQHLRGVYVHPEFRVAARRAVAKRCHTQRISRTGRRAQI
jgi:hypothetical protein